MQIRQHQGKHFPFLSLFSVFGLQAFLCCVVALPIQIGISQTGPEQLNLWDILGLTFWSIGFIFESIADRQLTLFKANPTNKNAVLNTGVWRYSRHPNYFGEALLWWGFAFLALSTEYGMWGGLGTLVINFLLVRISGCAHA